MTLPAGKQIGRYQLIELTGSGGNASVYQAYDPLFDRNVAIKLMHSPFLLQEEFRKRFLREAQATARLRHAGIVEILDYGETADQQLYLVMEFVPGPNVEQLLNQWRQAQRQIPLADAIRLMRQVAEATAFANEHGVLHRDLKPGNILLKPRLPNSPGEMLAFDPLITDFGLAYLEGSADVTQPGMSVGGTPAYMAPEQLGNEPLDERCDVYSLGVIFYEMVTGQLPYPLKTLPDALRQHALNALPLRAPQQLRPDLPSELDGLISQMLEALPERRLPSARALAQALGGLPTDSRPISAAPDHTVPDLTVPDLIVPDVRVAGGREPDPDLSDMTIPALSVPESKTSKPATSRPAQPSRSGKTEKPRTKTQNPHLALSVDPALTLVEPQPRKRNLAAIVLTTAIIVIAAALIWYFMTQFQRADNLAGAPATAVSVPTQAPSVATIAPTSVPTTAAVTSSATTGVESAITQTLAEPLATLTATLSSASEATIDPALTMTATVIGPQTSHPTQLWIDGDLTDWQVLRAFSKSKTTELSALSDNADNAGCQARFAGATATVDFGVALQFAYDTTYLYVSYLVQDDGYVANADPAHYDEGDAPELLLKLNLTNDSTVAPAGEDEFQIDFLPGVDQVGNRPALAIRRLAHPATLLEAPDATVAATVMDGGYFLEAALAWSSLGAAPPQAGQQLGVVANVSDSDTPATAQQECLLSSNPNYKPGLPASWTLLVLE